MIWSVRWSPNGDFLATTGGDGKVKLFDVKSRQVVNTFSTSDGSKQEMLMDLSDYFVANYRGSHVGLFLLKDEEPELY